MPRTLRLETEGGVYHGNGSGVRLRKRTFSSPLSITDFLSSKIFPIWCRRDVRGVFGVWDFQSDRHSRHALRPFFLRIERNRAHVRSRAAHDRVTERLEKSFLLRRV